MTGSTGDGPASSGSALDGVTLPGVTLPGATRVTEVPELEPRPLDSHKGTFGHVLIAAGSRFMPGAAVLSASAAYRMGAGLVTVLTDTDVIPLVAPSVVEAVFTDWTAIGEKLAIGEPLEFDAMLVGPGLGTVGRGRLVFDLMRAAPCPVVIDADALNLVAQSPGETLPSDPIWTPHPGELRRLSGRTPKGDEERLAAARAFVEERGGVIVLKGHHTIVMDRKRWAINETGNPGMATAGSGDVLAGAIVALLGQGLDRFDAALVATQVHGLAGDFAAGYCGEPGLVASDIVDALPHGLMELYELEDEDGEKEGE